MTEQQYEQDPQQDKEISTDAPQQVEYPDYHPGIEPGVDFIYGSDQDEYRENTEQA
ncbi:hypothetical protein PAESOLCIP111_00106 [Paenibacillus solanacearum]|uniref:Uncharacterized protein n=1 Tax=Paenibacillus solanacearum TaxID=2048548 RepID=A0A916JS79_9BACL|nr:hypothetical protein [Paenibacillus solanacearum]CAG7596934.1 hypothetical protein PAESOLCIP111_00106 [Paenibacillus solanacearum]